MGDCRQGAISVLELRRWNQTRLFGLSAIPKTGTGLRTADGERPLCAVGVVSVARGGCWVVSANLPGAARGLIALYEVHEG